MTSKASEDGGKPAATHEVNRVGIRVPPFYPEKPALWFAQLESQFVLASITTDSTKFHYAMGQLDPVYAGEVEDIITSPPETDKYIKLKTELIKRLSASREKRTRQLLTHEELGDRKPSQFLRHLRHLAGPGVPEEFLQTIWASRLPSSTQSIVASQSRATLEDLADLADRLQDIAPATPQVAATSTAEASLADQVTMLTEKMHAMTTLLERMSRDGNRGRNHERRQRSSSAQHSRSQSNYARSPLCWYHEKFGDKATRCKKPCDYAGKV